MLSLKDAEESREVRSNGKTTTTIIKLNPEGKRAISLETYRKQLRKESQRIRTEYQESLFLEERRRNHRIGVVRFFWNLFYSITP